MQAITNLVALINSMCAMMRVTPFHHENYSRLILGVVMQFYQRCSDRFQSLTTRTPAMPGVVADPSQFRTPAAWAQRSELMKCLLSLLASSVSCLFRYVPCSYEVIHGRTDYENLSARRYNFTADFMSRGNTSRTGRSGSYSYQTRRHARISSLIVISCKPAPVFGMSSPCLLAS